LTEAARISLALPMGLVFSYEDRVDRWKLT
jgi:hypothetical protein